MSAGVPQALFEAVVPRGGYEADIEVDGGMLFGYWTVRVRVVVRAAPRAEAVIESVEVPDGVPVITGGDAFVQAIAVMAKVMAKRVAIGSASRDARILVGRHQSDVVDRIIIANIKASGIPAGMAISGFGPPR
jgi:hypothetical protein